MCQTYASQGLPPLVRIPSPDPHAATTVLDGGAAGVIAPYVESVHQVKALRGAVKLRPIKGEKLEGILDGDPLEPTLKDYIKQRTADRLLIVNIESVPGINALDDILAIPDLDGVLIGPHDLSCNLGIPEQYDHPDFLEACKTIFHKARKANVGAGIHFWGDVSQQVRFLEMGANFLIHSADILLFQKYLSVELNAIRDAAEIKSDFPKRVKQDSI
jgi:4-hydroxy-2-oxoheptanedioate aldolase